MMKNNNILVPEAQNALENLKVEIASEIGLDNYDKIDKGNLTSRQNGYVGGLMVKHMIESFEKGLVEKNR